MEFRDGAHCSVCLGRYDFPCAGITESGFRKLGERRATWKCIACKSISPTPGKSIEMEGILSELKFLSAQMAALPTLVENVKKIQEEINDLKSIKTEIAEFKASLEYVHLSVSNLTEKMALMDQQIQSLQSTKDQISTLQQLVNSMERRAEEENQRARLNNIEIKGVPMSKNENLYDLVSKIGNVFKCDIAREQINYIARVPTRGDKQIKNIIVSVHNRYLRDNFVAAARTCKVLTASNLGLAGDNRIFINDHLTLRNKSLLNQTKLLAKEAGFEYTWVKNCKIFVRKNNTSPIYNIRSEQDLKKISR